MRRAKIVCTLGPATSSPRRIRELVYAGMDVARLNMSHGSHADHAEAHRLVREASDASGHGVGIFADLQGPKIRLEKFADAFRKHGMLRQPVRATSTDVQPLHLHPVPDLPAATLPEPITALAS